MTDKYKAEPMTSIPNTGKVIVKFWADWCGPCKSYGPQFDKATQNLTDIAIINVDVDKDSDLAQRFNIRGIPTTLFICNDVVVESMVGGRTEKEVTTFIEAALREIERSPAQLQSRPAISPSPEQLKEAIEKEFPSAGKSGLVIEEAYGMPIQTKVDLIRAKIDILKLKADPGNFQYADNDTIKQLEDTLTEINRMLEGV